MARGLTAWSREVALFTNGDGSLDAKQRGVLERNRIALYEERVARLEGDGGVLREVVLAGGRRVACDAIYLGTPAFQRSVLGARLGVEHDEDGGMRCGAAMETCVRGVYAAGNATRDVQLAIVAAAEGARAAYGINKALTRESLR
jgi:thioredoxin reductase